METNLKELIEQSHDPKENQRNVDDIINMVTAENLCSCRDPVNMAFQVHSQKMLSVTPCRPNLSFSVGLDFFMMVTSSGYPKDTVGNTGFETSYSSLLFDVLEVHFVSDKLSHHVSIRPRINFN